MPSLKECIFFITLFKIYYLALIFLLFLFNLLILFFLHFALMLGRKKVSAREKRFPRVGSFA